MKSWLRLINCCICCLSTKGAHPGGFHPLTPHSKGFTPPASASAYRFFTIFFKRGSIPIVSLPFFSKGGSGGLPPCGGLPPEGTQMYYIQYLSICHTTSCLLFDRLLNHHNPHSHLTNPAVPSHNNVQRVPN